MKELHIALVGNPNAGKSTIFNALTGSRQHVGNWPGKTVERKEGTFQYNDCTCKLVDLPGTYSLSAYSPEELIAREYILQQQPDVVISVLDAANLERNLYLTVQVLELGVPVVAALNMTDMAEARGLQIDREKLGVLLRSPVIRTTASKNRGIKALMDAVFAAAEDAE